MDYLRERFMTINFISPTTLTTAFLVGDTIANPQGSNDILPTLTKVPTGPQTGQPCCAGIEIQSSKGAMLLSRINAPQFAALDPFSVDGMIIYRSDLGEFLMRQAGAWQVIESGVAGAPSNAFYVITQPTAALPNATLTNLVDTFGTTNNLFLGLDTPLAVVAGNSNTGIGVESQKNLTTGVGNSTLGFQAGANLSTGSTNVLLGQASGISITTQNNNIAIGATALFNSDASANIAIGTAALFTAIGAIQCVAIGHQALTLNTANDCTAVGFQCLAANTIAINNTGVGALVLTANTGSENTGVGAGALQANTSAGNLTALGAGALNALHGVLASDNTAIGAGSMLSEQTGNSCTALGYHSLTLANGILNANTVAVGANAGALRAGYISCTLLGANADATLTGLTNATAIGAGTQVTLSNSMVLGLNCNVGINQPSPAFALDMLQVGGNCAIKMQTNGAADPAAPAAGFGILYIDNTGALVYQGSTTRTVLAPF